MNYRSLIKMDDQEAEGIFAMLVRVADAAPEIALEFEKQGFKISSQLEQAYIESLEPADRPIYAAETVENRRRGVASGVVLRDGQRISVGYSWPRHGQRQGSHPMHLKISMNARRRFMDILQEGREREAAEFDLHDAPLPTRTYLNKVLAESGFHKALVSGKSEGVRAGRGGFDFALSLIVKPTRIVPMDIDAQIFFVRRRGGTESAASTLAIDTQQFMFGYGYRSSTSVPQAALAVKAQIALANLIVDRIESEL